MLDLDPAAREVRRLLDGVTDDMMGYPTPCPDYSVAAILDHFAGLTLAFTHAAHKTTPGEGGNSRPRVSAEHLDLAWRTALPRSLDTLVTAWRDPAAWEGTTAAGGLTMPAEVAGLVALDELVLHGWDLARATGQEFRCDEASTEAVLTFTRQAARPEQAGGVDGVFGPVVEVPEDAPAFDRALGFAGRDPAWAPSTVQR